MIKKAAFIVDLHRCTGCGACVVACRLENRWPSSAPWRRVIDLNAERYPNGPTYFLSVACHHCENPACERACPSGAYETRANGIVAHDESRCLGCRYCEMACPFGTPRYDEERSVITKCGFCESRTSKGEQPACVVACPTGALKTASGDGDEAGVVAEVPGFADPAGCKPSIRFKKPRGIRGKRFAQFESTRS